MKRRDFLRGISLAGIAALAYSGARYWPESGFSNPCLSGLPNHILQHPLYEKIWMNIDPAQTWDCHVHMIGNGDSGRQDAPWHSPSMDSYLHPLRYVQKRLFMNGACVEEGLVDEGVVARLSALSREMKPGFKAMLLAFDWWHDEQGRAQPSHSAMHVANAYVAAVAKSGSMLFEWAASIHPYRADAIDALHEVRADGARAIKWLPQAMNIDPLSAKCDRFYQTCADLKLPIISHGGREFALPGSQHTLGNPLRLRRALDAGVKIAVAHCATFGQDTDLDIGKNGPLRHHFDLFARLMDAPQYENRLFGEISSLTLRNHEWAIVPLLQRQDWHHRLLNGSDYPLPGVMPLIDSASLYRQGLLDAESVEFLQAIKPYNALLFDFALKRLLHYKNIYFAPAVFQTRPFFES